MRIHFISFPETGHYLALFGLAREMADRGAEVRFLGTLDFQCVVEDQAFTFRPVLTDLFPKGHTGARTQVTSAGLVDWASGIRREFRTLQALSRRLLDGTVLAHIAQGAPDLVLIDSMLGFLALPAVAAGLPCGLVSLTLPRERDPDVPPLGCGLIPAADGTSRRRIRRRWRQTLLANRARAVAFSLVGMSPAALIARTTRRLETQTRDAGLSVRYDVEFGSPLPSVPEFILCGDDFDFPRRSRPQRHYVGPCVDIRRRTNGAAIPPEWLAGADRIVYCSLGTQNREYAETKTVFRSVVAACTSMPGYRLILSAGDCDVAVPPEHAHRVIVGRWIPQLTVLQHASVVVTNGSFNTVKECGWFGVPMLFRPSTRDHPGSAARAIHLGMGLPIEDLRVATLCRLFAQVQSEEVRTRVAAAQRRFRAAQDRLAPVRGSIDRICTERATTTVSRPDYT